MKSTFLSLGKFVTLSVLAIGMTLTSCKKEEETPEPTPDPVTNPAPNDGIVHARVQVPIVVKATGENCPPCGSWGWTDWIDLSNDLEGKAFCWANYAGGYAPATGFRGKELRAPASDAAFMLARFSGVTGYPNFVTNMTSEGTSSANAKAQALASAARTDAKISAGFKHRIEGDSLIIEAEAKVWQNLSGDDYYMGAYLVENDIVAYQAGTVAGGNNAKHHLVFRGSMTNSTWGEQIIDNSANENDIIAKRYAVKIPAGYDSANFTYGLIIWKKVLGYYEYENAATNQ